MSALVAMPLWANPACLGRSVRQASRMQRSGIVYGMERGIFPVLEKPARKGKGGPDAGFSNDS